MIKAYKDDVFMEGNLEFVGTELEFIILEYLKDSEEAIGVRMAAALFQKISEMAMTRWAKEAEEAQGTAEEGGGAR